MVGGHGPGGLAHRRCIPAHGRQRPPERLGPLRLREDAGLSLGDFPIARRRRTQNQFRRSQGGACLARCTRRASGQLAADHRHARRHGAGFGRAATSSGAHLPVALRPAQFISGQRRRGPASVGHGVSAATVLRSGRPRRGRSSAAAPLRRSGQSADSGRLQRKDSGLAGILHVHLLHGP